MLYITWTDLGLIILIVLGAITGVYLIILIRNLNSSVAKLKSIVNENEANINQTLKDIPVVTKNLIEISDTAKNEVESVGNAISSISEAVGSTAAAAGTFKTDILDRIKTVIDFIEVARLIYDKAKRKESNNKSA